METKQDLPREKLRKKGAEALSDIELLQAVIGSGGKDNDYKQIAKNLREVIKKAGAANLTLDDVLAVKGIGAAKATIVFAALEFWKREFTVQSRPIIDNAEKAAAQVEFIRNMKQEHFILLTLDGARRLIRTHTVSVGTINVTLVHPREIFAPAIEDRANSIVIAHNHPSGSLNIGNKDKEVTKRIKDASELLSIKLDDQ